MGEHIVICPYCFRDNFMSTENGLHCCTPNCNYNILYCNQEELEEFFSANIKYIEAKNNGMEAYIDGKSPYIEGSPIYKNGFHEGYREAKLEDFYCKAEEAKEKSSPEVILFCPCCHSRCELTTNGRAHCLNDKGCGIIFDLTIPIKAGKVLKPDVPGPRS